MSELISAKQMSSQEFGKALVESAKVRSQQKKLEKVVEVVESLMEAREHCDHQIKHLTDCKEKYDKQLAALEAGEFTVSDNGSVDPRNLRGIRYNDDSLNR